MCFNRYANMSHHMYYFEDTYYFEAIHVPVQKSLLNILNQEQYVGLGGKHSCLDAGFHFFEWAEVCDGYLVLRVKLSNTAFALLKPIIKYLSSMYVKCSGDSFYRCKLSMHEHMPVLQKGNSWASQYACGFTQQNFNIRCNEYYITCQQTNVLIYCI